MDSTKKRALSKIRKTILDDAVEVALARLVTDLQKWKLEIRKHHKEIAARNFAIGLEVHGFTEQFNPRNFRGMDMMGRIAKAINVHKNYLRTLVTISAWLYGERGVRNIRSYMKEHNLKTWNQVVDHFVAKQGRGTLGVVINRKHAGVIRSLEGFKEALPRQYRPALDKMMKQLTSVARKVTGDPLASD